MSGHRCSLAWIAALVLACTPKHPPAEQRPSTEQPPAAPPSTQPSAPAGTPSAPANTPSASTAPPAPESEEYAGTVAGRARSFYHPHGSSRHDSHVNVPRRKLSGMVRAELATCAEHPSVPKRKADVPLAVVVSPNGKHGVVARAKTVDVFDAALSCRVAYRSDQYGRRYRDDRYTVDVVALDSELFVDGSPIGWDLEYRKDQLTGGHSAALARDFVRYDYVVAFNRSPLMHPHGGYNGPDHLIFESGQRWRTGKQHWGRHVAGHFGLAAIAADWSVVLVLENNRLLVHAPSGDAQGNARLEATRQLPHSVQWLSLTGEHIALLSQNVAGARLSVLSMAAQPRYTVDVSFIASQPAIYGGGDRLYVVGQGLAAIDAGKVAWSRSFSEPAYASSFADGSVALAHGTKLSVLAPNGTTLQSFDTLEPLVTPPALAGDGAIWVASSEALYVAR